MPKPLYIVMHIPKTAGSTLRRNFELNFNHSCLFLYSDLIGQPLLNAITPDELREHRKKNGEILNNYVAQNTTDNIDFLFGHKVNTELHHHIRAEREPRYITFLREPVQRVISLYHFIRSSPQIPEDHVAIQENWSLEEWLERTKRDIKDSQLAKFLPEAAIPDETNTDEQLNFHFTPRHLEIAKAQLAKFWFVGLTETFNSDALYLYGKLGAKRFYPEHVVNASPNKKPVAEETRKRIANMNSLDCEFYQCAQAHRTQFLQNHRIDYSLQKNKAAVLQSLYKRRESFRPLIKIIRSRA